MNGKLIVGVCLIVCLVSGIIALSLNTKYVLLSVVYNTASRTTSVVNTRFNSLENCLAAKQELIKGSEFPYQQYFEIRGGCYKL